MASIHNLADIDDADLVRLGRHIALYDQGVAQRLDSMRGVGNSAVHASQEAAVSGSDVHAFIDGVHQFAGIVSRARLRADGSVIDRMVSLDPPDMRDEVRVMARPLAASCAEKALAEVAAIAVRESPRAESLLAIASACIDFRCTDNEKLDILHSLARLPYPQIAVSSPPGCERPVWCTPAVAAGRRPAATGPRDVTAPQGMRRRPAPAIRRATWPRTCPGRPRPSTAVRSAGSWCGGPGSGCAARGGSPGQSRGRRTWGRPACPGCSALRPLPQGQGRQRTRRTERSRWPSPPRLTRAACRTSRPRTRSRTSGPRGGSAPAARRRAAFSRAQGARR